MQIRKVSKILMAVALTAFLVTGCSNPSSGNSDSSGNTEKPDNKDNTTTDNTENKDGKDNTDNKEAEVKKKDYKFKVSALPYDSDGLTIYVQMTSSKYQSVVEELGKITSVAKDAVVEKTVKLPEEYDKFALFFIDDDNNAEYYTALNPDYFYNSESDTWEVDGFYYYYYEKDYNPKDPYAATDETRINDFALDTKYEFDASTGPYYIWKADNVIDKILKISIEGSSNVDVHISSNKADLMTYNVQALKGNFYECKTQTVYIMLKPKEYNFGENVKQPKCSITFTDFTPELEKCLEIDKAVLASNGKIYASGETGDSETKEILYCLDPKNNLSRTRVKNFNKTITSICELEEGILYVSYDYCISKVELSTGIVSEFAKDLPASPQEMAMYEDGEILIAGIEKERYTTDYLFLVDKDSGEYKEVKEQSGSRSISGIKDLQYYKNGNIFFYSFAGSPRDINYIKIDMTNPAKPEYVSTDSKYHGDYKMDYPIMIYKTNPLQILTAGGEIFDIDLSKIEAADPTLAPYYYVQQVEDWCLYNETSFRSYKDCYIMGEYIYYMNYDLINDTCSVEKCALTAPKTVLKQEIYEDEVPVKLYSADNKLYLLTNSDDCIYPGQGYYYKVYLHEIDF